MTQTSQPTPLPQLPKTQADHIDWIRLIRSRRVGPATFHRLMRKHGSARDAIEALPDIARQAGVTNYAPCPFDVAEAELLDAQHRGYIPLCYGAPNYPSLLAETPDAPPLLWAKGNISCLSKPIIALVGARNASSLGRRMTHIMAEGLADAGFSVVSGLARGIDAAAHTATLKAGTIAVVAGGLDVQYPRENQGLYHDIPETGLLLTEQPAGLVPQARHFPMRNRIIAGIAQAVVVMEGAARSGSLITARNALDLGREVMAVPGHPFDGRAAGCNFLIRDGASLVRSAKDVIDALALPPEPVAASTDTRTNRPGNKVMDASTADAHAKILNLLSSTAVTEDIVIRDSGLPACTVSQHLMDLELQGRIERQPGGLLALAG
jgi:DNA processing protein